MKSRLFKWRHFEKDIILLCEKGGGRLRSILSPLIAYNSIPVINRKEDCDGL